MKWHLDILPGVQRSLWDSTICHGLPGFVLYGGTALALRLGHRQSIDFDFFSAIPFAPLDLKERLGLAGEVSQAEPNTLTVFHEGVKLSFFGGLSLGVIAPPDHLAACPVASIPDLAGCKLAALVNRVELKDYLDVVAILRTGLALPDMLASANAIYHGGFPIAVCMKALVYFESGELARLPHDDRSLIEKAVEQISEIPSLPLAAESIS